MNKFPTNTTIELPKGMKHLNETGKDVITWSNRNMPLNSLLLIISTIAIGLFLLGALLMTSQVVNGTVVTNSGGETAIVLFLMVGLWLGFLLVLFSIGSQLFQRETIYINDEVITLSYSGLPSHKSVTVPKTELRALTFEKEYGYAREITGTDRFIIIDGPRNTGGSFVRTLKLVLHRKKGSITGWEHIALAIWLRSREQRQLYFYLQEIFQKRNWEIDFRLDEGSKSLNKNNHLG